MNATLVGDGTHIKHTPVSALTAGDVVVQSELVGIATDDIAAGELGSLAIEGVFIMPRSSVVLGGIAVGRVLYWDTVALEIRVTPGANGQRIGKAAEASPQSPQPIRVRLIP